MTKIPQISTRRYYDLDTGRTLRDNSYSLNPKKFFLKLDGIKELAIMIHGLRNNRKDAINKFRLAKNHLKKIGYRYHVVGFSYDSNTKGAHLTKYAKKSLKVGQKIAKKNGTNLGNFILDLRKRYPKIKIRLIGHSLGSEVILHAIMYLAKKPNSKNIVESAHFFGSSVTRKTLFDKNSLKSIRHVIRRKIVNYYTPNDDVLSSSVGNDLLMEPIGLVGLMAGMSKYRQKKVSPKNHRFASYIVTLKRFP